MAPCDTAQRKIGVLTLKNGLLLEDGELIYYEDDVPKHAGVVKIGKDIYYISSKGKAVKGQYIVHGEMTNGILKRGTYTFGEDGKLVKGSYIAPIKKKNKPRARATKRESLRKKWKKTKNKPVIFGALALTVMLLAAIWLVDSGRINVLHRPRPSTSQASGTKVKLPEFTEDVLLCTKAAKQEYDGKLSLTAATESGTPYRPLYFQYSLVKCSGDLFVGEKEDLSDARQYDLPEKQTYVTIDNLKTDTTYYYMVTTEDQEFIGSFHTAPSTRFVYIPGLLNTRDIGGYETLDGKKIKQGMLIRGVELDGLVNASYFVPANELENVQKTFEFSYDMDLRSSEIYNGTYPSRLGIAHKFYDAPMYGEIFNKTRHAALKQIFSDLADPNKYPMYLHCTWGQDRTGTIVYLLQGLLNVSEQDMKREYTLSGYVEPKLIDGAKIEVLAAGLQSYEGNTLQEKIVTFLKTEVGVTQAEIDSIRSILLEE